MASSARSALDRARERVHEILALRQPYQLDPAVEQELAEFRQMVADRPMEEFYAGEMEDRQDFGAL